MEHGTHELSAGYALDALEDGERRAFEQHLETCERCRDEVALFGEVAAVLAAGASGAEPPAPPRGRAVDAARDEPQSVVPPGPRRRPWSSALVAVASVAAVAAAALGIWALALADELGATRDALEREQAAARILADPTARSVAVTGAQGRLVVTGEGEAALVLDGLADAPAGRTYQLWVIRGETPVSAGVFDGAEAATAVPVEGSVPAGAVVTVTVERAGGAPQPTGDPVVASRPA